MLPMLVYHHLSLTFTLSAIGFTCFIARRRGVFRTPSSSLTRFLWRSRNIRALVQTDFCFCHNVLILLNNTSFKFRRVWRARLIKPLRQVLHCIEILLLCQVFIKNFAFVEYRIQLCHSIRSRESFRVRREREDHTKSQILLRLHPDRMIHLLHTYPVLHQIQRLASSEQTKDTSFRRVQTHRS